VFSPDFDPLDILMKQQHKISQLDTNIKQLAVAYNSRNELLDQMVENIKQLNDKVFNLEVECQRLRADITQIHMGRLPR
jgi:predicted  nucleic acid-binding Zn-ribbon protein